MYIIVGTAIVYGLPLEEAWMEVHKTNMKKERGPSARSKRFDIIKPKGWVKPDLKTILERVQRGL
jgi:predicted HAD superfamily Cof-like phosphohydrolase